MHDQGIAGDAERALIAYWARIHDVWTEALSDPALRDIAERNRELLVRLWASSGRGAGRPVQGPAPCPLAKVVPLRPRLVNGDGA